MATDAAIQRWDKILDEVEKTRKGCPFVHFLVPGYHQFRQAFPLLVDAITKAFKDAWQSDRPTKARNFMPSSNRSLGRQMIGISNSLPAPKWISSWAWSPKHGADSPTTT